MRISGSADNRVELISETRYYLYGEKIRTPSPPPSSRLVHAEHKYLHATGTYGPHASGRRNRDDRHGGENEGPSQLGCGLFIFYFFLVAISRTLYTHIYIIIIWVYALYARERAYTQRSGSRIWYGGKKEKKKPSLYDGTHRGFPGRPGPPGTRRT